MIPKKFHYVWFGPYIDSQTCVNDWCNVCPEYQLIKWTNETVKDYLDEAISLFGKQCLSNKTITYVSDLVRLLILRDYGGIYIDHDIVLVKDITPLLKTYNLVLTFQYRLEKSNKPDIYGKGETLIDIVNKGYELSEYNSDNVNNCIIAVTPNHPFIQKAIELTLKNHNRPPSLQYPMSDWGVGPSVFSDAARSFDIDITSPITVEKDGTIIYSTEYLHPLHGVDRKILGPDKYYARINEIISNKEAYAVHIHEHFGTGMFLNKTLIFFNQWYEENYKS